MVARLHAVTDELRTAAQETGREIDWNQFEAFLEKASSATTDENFSEAISNLGHAISFVVAEIKKKQMARRPSDSHVDLF